MIGFYELLALAVFLCGIAASIGVLVWILRRVFAGPRRTPTRRLAELDAMRKNGQITAAEYDRQRAAIIGDV